VNSVPSRSVIQVQDFSSPAQTTTISGNIHVAPVLAIATPTGPLPDAVVGQAYNFTFKSNGGLTPITWSVKSGTLPTGLTLSPKRRHHRNADRWRQLQLHDSGERRELSGANDYD